MNIVKRAGARFKSLKIRLLLPVALMMVAIVLSLTAVVTRAYTQTMLDQENAKIQTSFTITGKAITAMLDSVQTMASRLILDSRVELYASDKFSSDLERVLARKEVLSVFEKTLQQHPSVYGLLFVRENGSAFGSLPYRSIFFDENPADILNESIMDCVRSTRGGTRGWTGPLAGSDLYGIKVLGRIPSQVALGVSSSTNIRYGTVYALSIIDAEVLGDYLDMLSDGRSSIYLTNGEGAQLAESLGSGLLSGETWKAVDASKKQGSASVARGPMGEREYVSYRRIDKLGWYLIRELPMTEYDRSAEELRAFVWKSALLVFGVAILWYAYWLRGFMKTFASLKAAIVRSGEGRLETRIEKPFAISEFEGIRQEFNTMNTALEQLIETSRSMERAKLELELQNLQTQLSPHMIFNSITAIRWMASMMGADRVSDMLVELSEMLRPVFRDWKIEWTLGEEMAHLTHYAKLLDLRYGNNFSMTCLVSEEMNALRIPRFTIQPLVENACEHGGASAGSLRVEIRASVEGDCALITVYNDGADISPQAISEIEKMMKSGGRSQCVGILNVYNRLRICMGKDSALTVERPERGGTLVTVKWKLPDKAYQNEN